MRPDPAEVDACLRVLARLAEEPADPALAQVQAAVDLAYRAGKKQRKTARHAERRERDRALLATATRFRVEPDGRTRYCTGDRARMDADGNAKVFRDAMQKAGCTMQTLPDGVEYHCREDERAVYHFYLNTTEADKTVAVPAGKDLLTDATVSGEVTLGKYAACVVEAVK